MTSPAVKCINLLLLNNTNVLNQNCHNKTYILIEILLLKNRITCKLDRSEVLMEYVRRLQIYKTSTHFIPQ